MTIFSGNLNRARRAIVDEFTADLLGNGGSGVVVDGGLLTAVIFVAQRQIDRAFERTATVEIVPAAEGLLLFELLLLHPGYATGKVRRGREVRRVEVVNGAGIV